MHNTAKYIAFTIIFSLFSVALFAQNSLDGKAEKCYRSNDFSEALPLYQTLVKKYKTNAKYNHRLGVCLLETKGSLTESEKHLKYAKNKGIRYANFFLGQVYKNQYKFNDAISAYHTYLRGIRSDNENYNFVKRDIEHCQKLNEYLLRTEEIELLNTQVVPTKDFHEHYELSKESGKILLSSNIWETSDSGFVMYMNELEDRVCYPRIIGDTLDTDLFEKNRLLDKWGAEEHLSSVVNSEGNELYPYILDDGLTLYFSSNGHGGLGGYDIFVTRYNPQTNKYLTPTNLGMPYNSTGDDFLYVVDEFSDKAWFASDRNNKYGEITIYNFKPNALKKTTSLQGADLRAAARLLIKQDSLGNLNPIDSLLQEIKPHAFKEEDRAIYFVVNDTLIYKSTLQFVSASALHSFAEGEKNMLLLEQHKKGIAFKRESFSTIKNPAEREEASREILKLENAIYELESSLETPFQLARNKEMEVLKEHNYALFSAEDYRINLDYSQQIDTPNFILPTIRNNYSIIFSKEEAEQFISIDGYLTDEYQAITTLSDASGILDNIENSTTSFWRSLRKVDTTFQYADSLQHTKEILEQNLHKNYTSSLNHLLDKVDILERKAQLLYLFVRGQEYKDQMQELLLKAEKEKSKSSQQLISVSDTTLHKNMYDPIKISILKCQEMYEFSLVYYIEDYGGSLSLIPDTLLNDSSYIDSLVKKLSNPTIITDSLNASRVLQTGRLVYKVQLGVFSKELSKDLLSKLPEVTTLQIEESNLIKYFAGDYSTKEEARSEAKSFEKYGFKGAFVVPFIDGTLASWEEVNTFKTSQ